MNPVYDVDGIQIWHADCADVLPTIDPADVDLLLTDPPYGINYKPLRGSDGSKRWTSGVIGDTNSFDPLPLVVFQRCILWGANNYASALPSSAGWLIWDKIPKGRKEGFIASDAELAWTTVTSRVHKFSLQWGGEARNNERHLHPTQKPVALMRWILDKWTEPGDLVLDPYMGSGPIARACADLGRRYIGIEIVEEYVDAAINRLGQMTLEMNEERER